MMNDPLLKPIHILLVDDNPNNLKVLSEAILSCGWKALMATDGESAIEQAEYAHPDLILLDVMMPGLDGFEACRRLKAKTITQNIPVIFMTALSDVTDKVKGLELGAVDYVELPSQFMENWCYDRPTLFGMAKHYETGEPLPEHYYQKLLAAKNYMTGSAILRQIHFSLLDIELHHRYRPGSGETPKDVRDRLAKTTTVLPPLPEDSFLCAFAHIFAGGYAAGYYSYKWAEVLSADAFAAFEEAGLDNEQAITATGKRYRDTVLALGGSQHPMEVFKSFRGREPSTEPLLRHNGLAVAA
ncbi:hypothetical protein NUACC21_01250 [Scytonema sp. NUACC21]